MWVQVRTNIFKRRSSTTDSWTVYKQTAMVQLSKQYLQRHVGGWWNNESYWSGLIWGTQFYILKNGTMRIHCQRHLKVNTWWAQLTVKTRTISIQHQLIQKTKSNMYFINFVVFQRNVLWWFSRTQTTHTCNILCIYTHIYIYIIYTCIRIWVEP